VVPLIGHNTPQEAPAAVAEALLELIAAQPASMRRAG
jgi:pimeloyl-ACP methyl ester carboxylesterase